MRSPSSASVMAPTSGPNSRTDASPKTSHSENRDWIDGILMVSVPQTIVSAENSTHSVGTVPAQQTATL